MKARAILVGALLAAALLAPVRASAASLTPGEARALAKQAYVVTYPLLQNYADVSRVAFDRSSPTYRGTGRFARLPLLSTYLTSQVTNVASTNHDTLYSLGVLDLRREPGVVTAGAVHDADRYWSVQLLDLDTDVLPYVSSLTAGTAGGRYLVLGPGQHAPADARGFDGVIRAHSRIVTVLGRVQARNDVDQVPAALVQQRLAISSLSAYEGRPGPRPARALPPYHGDATGFDYLRWADRVLSLQPLEASDPALAARLRRIHVGAGERMSASRFSPRVRRAILAGLADGRAAVDAEPTLGTGANGWGSLDSRFSEDGSFGRHYLFRAAVAKGFVYANTRRESWYALARADSSGAPLDGRSSYRLHFPAGSLPPARYFWSITAYDASTYGFFDAPRYSISSTTPGLRRNADGSLDVPVQAAPPTSVTGLADWLPVGRKPFYLVIRAYGPDRAILDGPWSPPAVQRQ